MDKRRLGLTMFACACSVAWVEAMAGQMLAAQKSTKAGSKLPDVFIISKQQSHALEK